MGLSESMVRPNPFVTGMFPNKAMQFRNYFQISDKPYMPSPNIPTYSKIGLMYTPITPIYEYVPIIVTYTY